MHIAESSAGAASRARLKLAQCPLSERSASMTLVVFIAPQFNATFSFKSWKPMNAQNP
jgi:hypothetical protein